jgi:pimeloyl-ACP methyl ester carboxylesterase
MTRGTVKTDRGDEVAHDRYGDGPAVVFIAGAGPWREIDPTTSETAELLAKRGFTTVVHDRVGRGTNRVEGTIDLGREIAAIGALVERVGGHATLVGHSSGCSIALYAAAHGVAVDGLMLWEAPMDPATPDVAAWTAEVERLLDAGTPEAALEHYLKDIPEDILEGMREGTVWEQMVAQAESLRPDAQSLRWAYSAPFADVFGTTLAGAGVPVRPVHGTETFPEMPAAAAAIAAAVPGSTPGEVAGAWHTWNAAAMADELAAFVGTVARA